MGVAASRSIVKTIFFLVALLLINYTPNSAASPLKADETLLLYRTQGYLTEDGGEWVIPLHGWVGELEEGSILRATFIKSLEEFAGEEWSESERELFEERIKPFLADDERGKEVEVVIGGVSKEIGPSSPDGHLYGAVSVPVDSVDEMTQLFANSNSAKARVLLLPQKGLSVVSDIDDTIKISNVSDKAALMKNTFLRPFLAVEGMSALYRSWEDRGAHFHYLSGSPWQLYSVLDDFIAENSFPEGAFYLRRIRFNPLHLGALFDDPKEFKISELEELFKRYPLRKFVLLGDSGEMDPEVYGEAARRHPERVNAIFIRDVTGDGRDGQRYLKAFKGVPKERWRLFKVGEELLNEDINY